MAARATANKTTMQTTPPFAGHFDGHGSRGIGVPEQKRDTVKTRKMLRLQVFWPPRLAPYLFVFLSGSFSFKPYLAVRSALALCQQFTVHGDVLERVEVFRYLSRLLSQDDDDIQAV
jgi:hypothetical protein